MIRGAVASVRFDHFHRNSANIIKQSCLPYQEDGQNNVVYEPLVFPQNNLYVTSIDVQSVKPADPQTEKELQKSVTQAIKITTDSEEATARQEAERKQQQASVKKNHNK